MMCRARSRTGGEPEVDDGSGLETGLVVEPLAGFECREIERVGSEFEVMPDDGVEKVAADSLALVLGACAHRPDPDDRTVASRHHQAGRVARPPREKEIESGHFEQQRGPDAIDD